MSKPTLLHRAFQLRSKKANRDPGLLDYAVETGEESLRVIREEIKTRSVLDYKWWIFVYMYVKGWRLLRNAKQERRKVKIGK